MRKLLTIYAAVVVVSMILINVQDASAQVQLTCVEANGLNWCYNPNVCGQACNELCKSGGMKVIDDDEVWFEAQNTADECAVISEALGLGGAVNMGSWSYGCLEDSVSVFPEPGLNGPLLCSFSTNCPSQHRTYMDNFEVACDSGQNARRSICPCEEIPARPIPTLSEWGIVAMAGVLGLVGYLVIRRRKAAV